ncbi:hypothetical protein L202_06215 [Cryptococcus amylolentus CBS 6039]|uniref:Uncharacterized protein n=1 Tax=Cryptococcus amylolentus CBS 6039 TaxID=1295533 RepID=A0A1E3HKM1_9TREE|nr:hypothetical protein L202_06215 [Cryptococcus amylolentus CBS 6039]ODN76286.1 hypothetical protein L202_06215 [Cryptococcus amylolentus CBS 6039]
MTVRPTALRLARHIASLHESFPFSGHRRSVIPIATSPNLRLYSLGSDPRNASASVTSIPPPEYTWFPPPLMKRPSNSNTLVQRKHDPQSIKGCHPVFEAVLERFRYWERLDTSDAETIELVIRDNGLHFHGIVEALLFKYEANTVGLTIGSIDEATDNLEEEFLRYPKDPSLSSSSSIPPTLTLDLRKHNPAEGLALVSFLCVAKCRSLTKATLEVISFNGEKEIWPEYEDKALEDLNDARKECHLKGDRRLLSSTYSRFV